MRRAKYPCRECPTAERAARSARSTSTDGRQPARVKEASGSIYRATIGRRRGMHCNADLPLVRDRSGHVPVLENCTPTISLSAIFQGSVALHVLVAVTARLRDSGGSEDGCPHGELYDDRTYQRVRGDAITTAAQASCTTSCSAVKVPSQ